MKNNCNKKAKPLSAEESSLLNLIRAFKSKKLRVTPIAPHKYTLEFSEPNYNIAARFNFNKDVTRLHINLTGVSLGVSLHLRKNTQIQKAIKLAVDKRKYASTKSDRLVLTDKEVNLQNINQSLRAYLNQQKCLDLMKIIFPDTKKSQIQFRKNISFKRLKQLNIKEITLKDKRYICDYENGVWVEDEVDSPN